MKQLYSIIKRIVIVVVGVIWGMLSFFGVGYSILIAGNMMEEPGSVDYVAEGEAQRIYGVLAGVLYIVCFVSIVFFFYKRKKNLYTFLLSTILGGVISGIYIFVFRGY